MQAQAETAPIVKEVVLVGGGHTHALVLRRWGMRPVPGARLTLIDPGPTAPYSGMLPGHIAGHYPREALDIDLVRLARFAGARLILGAAAGIDPEARHVQVPGRAPIGYDLCSIDIGITARMDDLPGFAAHGVPAKPLDGFARRWATFCALDRDAPARVVILGGGVAGVELSLACAHRLRQLGRAATVTVLDRGEILAGVAPRARARLLRAMADWNVQGCEGMAPAAVEAEAVVLADGRRLSSDLTIGAAGAVPHPWLAETGLALEGGFVAVDANLRSLSHPSVYAAGDCAYLSHAPRPKAGVFAVRAAPVLAWNLRADLIGAQRRRFHPQRDFLKLISLGRREALAEKAGIAVHGPAMWRWKDRIDRGFMDRFRHLPPMPAPAVPRGAAKGVAQELAGAPPCGGCGAKLGPGALAGLLGGAPGEDAAVETVGGVTQVWSHDHLRAFALDPVLVAQAAAVHAMGDIWAMGAAPKSALAQVILPRMAARLQRAWLEEVMTAAAAVFAQAGVRIVGGHSSMGTELTIGFSVRGETARAPLRLAGAQVGDALILTRALGTGVILAAEMQRRARGGDVAAAWAQMTRPQGDAAERLAPIAHAMTDVTGFGLAGHLDNLCRASGLGARLDRTALPFLPGARDLVQAGLEASLFAQNKAAMSGRIEAGVGPEADLLFDPQTAGGFLAAVPEPEAAAAVADLRRMGHDAAVIGVCLPPEAGLRLEGRERGR